MSEKSAIIIVFFVEKCYNEINMLMRWRKRNGCIIQKIMDYADRKRHKDNKKMFAAIYENNGNIWVNVKCDPNLTYMWRNSFESVVPAYHMNKEHWNSIILDGSLPYEDIKLMICDSYELTINKSKR